MPDAIDLIDTDRATQNPALAKLHATAPATLASLITDASGAICRMCHRSFKLQAYTHYLDGGGYPYEELYLPEIPVVSLTRLAASPTQVLHVSNTDRDLNQRATVATTAAGLTLSRVASGVTTTETIAYADAVTLTALADAIASLGTGWSATLGGQFARWPSVDLRPLQGALNAMAPAVGHLELYTEDLPSQQWRLDPGSGRLAGHFPQGSLNIRVDYSAGYATVPGDVQRACVQLVADLSAIAKRDNTVQSVKIGPFAKTYGTAQTLLMQSATVKSLLSTYVDHAKVVGL